MVKGNVQRSVRSNHVHLNNSEHIIAKGSLRGNTVEQSYHKQRDVGKQREMARGGTKRSFGQQLILDWTGW